MLNDVIQSRLTSSYISKLEEEERKRWNIFGVTMQQNDDNFNP